MSTTTEDIKRLTQLITPKARFQLSRDNVTKHRDMVDTREFERGADFAMAEYVAEASVRETNPAVLGMKIVGAQEFLKCFKMLGEQIEIKPLPKVSDNLSSQ